MATSIKKSHNLKYLKTKLEKLNSQREILIKETKQKQNELNKIKKEMESLLNEINRLQSGDDLIFSEHAILRYIERVMGIDLDELKEKILPKNEREKILNVADSMAYKKDNYEIKIIDKTIVTITKREKS